MARWFGVRCIFKRRSKQHYEERITLWHADSFETAIKRAEAEAIEYQEISESDYLRIAQAYELPDGVSDGSEVFSLFRESSLGPEEYVSRFFDSGTEVQKKDE